MHLRWSAWWMVTVVACSGSHPGNGDDGDDDGPRPPLDQIDLFAIEHPAGGPRELHAYHFASDGDWSVMPAGSFRWSPDRATILVVADPEDRDAEDPRALTLLHLGDGSTAPLAARARDDGIVSAARWSPDGANIAIDVADASAPAGHRWTVFDRDGVAHPTIDPGTATYESSDVVYSAAGHLVFRAPGVMTYCAPDGSACVSDPRFCSRSPDDALIACSSDAGTSFTRVADNTLVGAWTDRIDNGAWSPDGTHFAGVSIHDDTLTYLDVGAISDVASTVHVEVGSSQDFAWSPDSSHLAFGRVSIVAVDGSGRLDHAEVNWGRWLDGATFVTNQSVAPGTPALLAVGDPVVHVVDGQGAVQIVWFDDDGDQGVSPDGSRFAYAAGLTAYLCSTTAAHCDAATTGLVGQVGWYDGDALLLIQSFSTSGVLGSITRVPADGSIASGHPLSFAAPVTRFTVR